MSDTVASAEGVTLLEGEEVLYNEHPAWSNYATELIVCSLLTLFTFGIGIVSFIYPYLSRKNTRYIVTDERVIRKGGILSSSSNEYRIEDINQLQTGATWAENLRGKGNIQFSSAAGGKLVTFGGITDHESVSNTIRKQQRAK